MTEMSKKRLLWMYERMRLIRAFEEQVVNLFNQGTMSGAAHIYAGEEAIAVGVMAHLTDQDRITSTHRGHGHCIAKGVDVKRMMAELYGKATGACKGRGGSMHIADIDKGMLGANGIVGAGGPLACGSALTAKVLGTDHVTVCFFGDGASEQGTMHESMNLAGIWKLPVVFVCENNMYAESTPSIYHCSAEEICARAAAYNIPGSAVDGTDVLAVYEASGEAIRRARVGAGPSLIEARAFRYYGHFMGDPQVYKTESELQSYKARDPITRFRKHVLEHQLISESELTRMDDSVDETIKEAVRFAEESPLPAPEECLADVYVSYPREEVGP